MVKNNIHVKNYMIIDKGDPSVGIFESSWEIKDDFIFTDIDQMIGFEDKLKEAFEYATDCPKIIRGKMSYS
jgi:hypothetical protein